MGGDRARALANLAQLSYRLRTEGSGRRVAYEGRAVAMEIHDVGLPRELADQLVRAE